MARYVIAVKRGHQHKGSLADEVAGIRGVTVVSKTAPARRIVVEGDDAAIARFKADASSWCRVERLVDYETYVGRARA